eukprot:scaffold80862_cov64-Phaeocystis_antarctica.AAC.6
MGATNVSLRKRYCRLEAASGYAGQRRSQRATSGVPSAVACCPAAMSEGSSLSVGPRAVVCTVEAQDGAKRAVRRPAQQVPRRAAAVVAAAVRVHEGLEAVHACIHHGLDARLQTDAVASPPHRVAVLSGRLGRALVGHAGPPIGQPKLGERHRPNLVRAVGRGARAVDGGHHRVVDVRAPGGVVQPLPHARGVRGVDEGRRDREGPVVVEPPEGEPRLEPLCEAVEAEGHLCTTTHMPMHPALRASRWRGEAHECMHCVRTAHACTAGTLRTRGVVAEEVGGRTSSLEVCSPPASREATGKGSARARGGHRISRSADRWVPPRFEWRSVTVVEVGAQPLGLEEVEPCAEVREECRGRVVVVAVLACGRVAPVHVQCPHVDGQLPRRPARDVVLGLGLGVLVPPSAPRRLPARERAAQQEDVRVARHVVREVVAVGVGVRGAGGRGRRPPARREEAGTVDQGVDCGGEWRRPVE